MNEPKWTKGPWYVFNHEDYTGPSDLPGLGVYSKEHGVVVHPAYEPETSIEWDGDAYLIAAAPELYDALENLLAVVNGEGGTKADAREIASEALAKARGETNE